MTAEFVPPRVPLVDLRTGNITREWFLLLRTLFTNGGISNDMIDAIGPATGGGVDAALAALAEIQMAAAVAPPSTPLFIAADDVLPAISILRDEIASLRAAMDDLRKGLVIL